MTTIDGPEVENLLARHGITRASKGDGGIVDGRESCMNPATVRIERRRNNRATMVVLINGICATGPCPLDDAHALSIAGAFRMKALLPNYGSASVLARLLGKMSKAFLDSGANAIVFHDVRLYREGYSLGPVVMAELGGIA